MQTPGPQRGFTWIETTVVMTIIGVVTTQAAPAMSGLIDSRRLEGAAVQFATDVQYARTEAIARNLPVRLSLRNAATGTCYVLHTGTSAQCSCTGAEPAICTGDAREIKTVFHPSTQGITIAANAASVAFDPLHGTSTPTATVRILGRQGRAIHHVINVMGRVRSCTPSGGVVGYVSC
jgi:type IV fimbrial biogenesis protein FimT